MNILAKIRDETGLRGRTLRGGAWLATAASIDQGSRLLRNLILARLLAPEVFGIFAIVLSCSALLQVITAVGVREAIIQSPHGTERTYLNGAWWLSMVRAIMLYVAAFVAAPWVGTFYGTPMLGSLIRVEYLGVLLQGALSPGTYVAIKEMRYSRWVLIQQGGGIVGVLVTIVLAFWLRGVWALVLGDVVESSVRCVLSYLIAPHRPGFKFHKEHVRALLGYSRGIFGLPALLLIYTEGPTFVVGKIFPMKILGLYAMALALARIPTLLSGLLNDLLMPALSTIQQDKARVNQALLKVTSLISLVSIPALAFVCAFSRPILALCYGPDYARAALPFAILFANEVLTAFNRPLSSAFLSLGEPALLRRFSFVRALILAVLIYPAAKIYGLVGAAVVPLFAMLVACGFQLARIRTLTNLDVKQMQAIPLRSLPLALPIIVLWVLRQAALDWISPLAAMMVVLILCGILYLTVGMVVIRSPLLNGFFWPFDHKRESA